MSWKSCHNPGTQSEIRISTSLFPSCFHLPSQPYSKLYQIILFTHSSKYSFMKMIFFSLLKMYALTEPSSERRIPAGGHCWPAADCRPVCSSPHQQSGNLRFCRLITLCLMSNLVGRATLPAFTFPLLFPEFDLSFF